MQYTIILSLALAPFFAYSQNFDQIKTAFVNGKASQICQYIETSADLTIEGQREKVDKDKATLSLNRFLQKFSHRTFNFRHQGQSDARDSNFHIGKLTADGQEYRVFFYFREINGKKILEELSIEKE